MKLTLYCRPTEETMEFYETLKVEGLGGSIKAVRLDDIRTDSEHTYAIRLKGSLRDCWRMLRNQWEEIQSSIIIGWP